MARLATVDSENKPHLVPVVFVFDGKYYYVPLDEKIKKDKPERLKRVKNIQRNPNVVLLIDRLTKIGVSRFIMIQGRASLIGKKVQHNELVLESSQTTLPKIPSVQKNRHRRAVYKDRSRKSNSLEKSLIDIIILRLFPSHRQCLYLSPASAAGVSHKRCH